MDKEREQIAARLREARQESHFEDAAAAANHFRWPVVAYRSHENAIRGLRPSVAQKYAKAFGVSFAWLLINELPKRPFGVEAELAKLPPNQSASMIKAFHELLSSIKVRGTIG